MSAEGGAESGSTTARESPPAKPSLPPATKAVSLEPGTVVGRHVIIQPLGRGGMSEVMLAHDTQLGRSVAIKVLLTSAATEEGRLRMAREAQAMAQLSHPNVLTIYDVGEHGGNLYLAMEYIEGETLQQWLQTPRAPREVLSVMRQAGSGLVAAHAAGIVHRDFKPANVMIARDGHVCVLDFGIARAVSVGDGASADGTGPVRAPSVARAAKGNGPSSPNVTSSGAVGAITSAPTFPSGDKLTEEGAIIGTIGYLAPESAFEQTADERSDVFSFCVVLWRALYGVSPFPNDSIESYLEAVANDKIVQPPGTRRVPAWLHEVARKGLHADPARRHASMSTALEALNADPARGRAARVAALVALGTAAVAALGVVRHQRALHTQCAAEGGALSAMWTGAARESARAAMLASADPLAPDRAERALETLDAYAPEWGREQQASCEATRIAGTQSAAVYEKRSGCLLGARQKFEVVVELLGRRDSTLQRHASEVAHSLSPPRLCSGRDAEHAFVPLPDAPAARTKAEEGRRFGMRAQGLLAAGNIEEALKSAEQARTLAHDAAVPGDEAAALLTIAIVHDRSFHDVEALQGARDAVVLAEAAGADRIAGVAAASAARIFADRFRRLDEARSWLALAQAKNTRMGGDDQIELAALGASVMVESKAQNAARAVEENARLIEKVSALLGPTAERVCGERYNRGLLVLGLPDNAEAIRALRGSFDCFESATGPRNPWLGVVMLVLADALGRDGKLDEAVAAAARAAELRSIVGPKDVVMGSILSLGAVLASKQRRFADAERDARRALAMADGQAGSVEEYLPNALYALGVARLAQGDARDARVQCARGVELLDRSGVLVPDSVVEGDALRCLGEADLALGDVDEARRLLERSVALPKRWYADDLPLARFALARALAKGTGTGTGKGSRPDPERARQLATQAQSDLRALVKTQAWVGPELEDVGRWLGE